MDAYTAFSVNNPSAPSQFYFIHNLIIPIVSGYIKWCKTAIQGIGKWVEKMYASAERESADVVVALLPARTDTRWFHEYIYGIAEIRFLRGRLKFGNATASAPFPSMVVIWRPKNKTP